MILDILVVRNKKLGCYANPWYSQEKLENVISGMGRSLVASEEARKKYAKCALYHFGTFNDETGKFDLFKEPVLLCDCDDILAQIPEEK